MKKLTVITVLCLLLCACNQTGIKLDGAQPDGVITSQGGRAIVQGDWVYYLNGDNYIRLDGERIHPYRGAICRMKKDGSEMAMVCQDDVSVFYIKGENIVYVAYTNGRCIARSIKTDGTARKDISFIDSIFDGGGFAACDDCLYYINGGYLYRCLFDGTEKTKISETKAVNMICSQDSVYYTEYNGTDFGLIQRVKHNSVQAQPVSDQQGYVLGIDGLVFWYRLTNAKCYSFNPETGEILFVTEHPYDCYSFTGKDTAFAAYCREADEESEDAEAPSGVYSIDLNTGISVKLCDDRAERLLYHEGWVYYINDSELYSLYRVSSDGKYRECLVKNMISNFDALDIADDWLYYFNDSDEGRIYRFDINTLKNICIEYEYTGMVA